MTHEQIIDEIIRAIEAGELSDDQFAELPIETQRAVDDKLNPRTCLDARNDGENCQGRVEPRESLSGTGLAIDRCGWHWTARLRLQREIDQRYPQHAPPDFDPLFAGESWDED